MKGFVKFLSIIFSVAVITSAFAACGAHTHKWGPWQRNEEEHWRTCTVKGCTAEERGAHANVIDGESVTVEHVCDECVEFKVLALGFLEGEDPAHSDFAAEANAWFSEQGKNYGFYYDFTTDFGALTDENLKNYDLVMFLNNRPYAEINQTAFENYMENGGAWMGFHVCAYADSSTEPWDWYFENFLGTGKFRTNTWNPTRETLKVETHYHYATSNLPDTINSAYNEWYNWTNDLRENKDITILLSLDPETYPVGDRPGEIWTEYSDAEYCPVAWQNVRYNMIYMNMGHNLQSYNDYEKQSETFESREQNQFILDSMLGLVGREDLIVGFI